MKKHSLLSIALMLNGMAYAAPNVVLIMADDFGVGSINAYGAPEELVKTPNLNKLAESGMRFTNANTPASICSPTRYALLTGRYAWRGPLPFGVVNVFDPLVVETDRMTLPKYLQGMGYATAQIGKWHLGLAETLRRHPILFGVSVSCWSANLRWRPYGWGCRPLKCRKRGSPPSSSIRLVHLPCRQPVTVPSTICTVWSPSNSSGSKVPPKPPR